MAKRFYITNAAPPYAPTTARGAWDDAGNLGVTGGLLTAKSGAADVISKTETNVAAAYDVLLASWVASVVGNHTIDGTVQWVHGLLESSALSDMVPHLHVYVTVGDSDTVRGTLLSDFIGATEYPTTAAGATEGAQTLSSVAALNGDRVVVEVGFRANNVLITDQTGTINFGGTGGTDLTDGSTSVTTQPGWVEFSYDFSVAPPPAATRGFMTTKTNMW